MAGLSYGLNITKKPAASRPVPARRKPIFGEDDSEDEDGGTTKEQNGVEEIGVFGEVAASQARPSTSTKKAPLPALSTSTRPPPKPSKPLPPNTANLASSHTSSKHSNEAQTLDPTIYDYDASYDALHAPRNSTKSAEDAARKPKYMSNLLAAAEVRKRDQLRAKDKLLVREREAEGDEYADKEKFVTGAYKAQQEEMRQAEAQERLREEAERKKGGSGMGAFYRGMLDKTEKMHEESVEAAKKVEIGDDGAPIVEESVRKEKTDVDKARELRQQGRDVVINDEGQVVDKRQLLSAGLNATPQPPRQRQQERGGHSDTPGTAGGNTATGPYTKESAQRAQRDRQTRMLEEQLLQSAKQTADEEEKNKAELERASKSRKTEVEIGSAKERYLARKREREQEMEEEKERKKKSKT